MPFVRIDMLSGRGAETKQALVRDVTEVVARHTGADAGHIQVLVSEHDAGDWSLGGTMLAQIPKDAL